MNARRAKRAAYLVPAMPQAPPPNDSGEVVTHVFTTEARPWRKNLKDYARQNRRQATEAENALWQALRSSQLGVRFRRQHAIGPYIVDFICIK